MNNIYTNKKFIEKLDEAKKANTSNLYRKKIYPFKLNTKQRKIIVELATREEMVTLNDVESLFKCKNDEKIKWLYGRILNKRKELSKLVDFDVENVRNSNGYGFVYLIVNEIYNGWVKCGKTTNVNKRLISYNTCDPLRRYRILCSKEVSDRNKTEQDLLKMFKLHSSLSNGEWFKINFEKAIEIFESL